MRKNEKGSALVWSVVVIMVITIIIAAGLLVVQKNYNTTIKNASKAQAELAAKSAIDGVLYTLQIGNHESELVPSKVNESISFDITLPDHMGTVEEAYIKLKESKEEKNNNYLVVSVSTKYNNQTASISARLYKEESDWKVDYYGGEKDVE